VQRPPMLQSLRILVCTPGFAPQVGGAETWMREVTKGLGALGHRLLVVAKSTAGVPATTTVNEIPVHRTRGGRAGLAIEILRLTQSYRPDVVLAQYSALPFAVLAAHRSAVPAVGVVHDIYGFGETLRLRGSVMGTLRFIGLERSLRWIAPDALLVPSRATASSLERIARRGPITVVPAGADHLPLGPPVARDRSRVLFLGRLVRSKGVDDLIAALRMLRRRGVCCRAVVVGVGPEAHRLRAAAADLGPDLMFLGTVTDAALDGAIRSSAALVLPSKREGWGLAITEAATRGIPYVAYDIPAVREQHDRLQGGLVVPPDPRALTDAIQDLVANPAKADLLGQRGRDASLEMTWASAARVVGAALTDAVAQHRRRRGTTNR
jgi:glycosyltransferase involved in cell wall biosynthesis